jgi:hypothetical protein
MRAEALALDIVETRQRRLDALLMLACTLFTGITVFRELDQGFGRDPRDIGILMCICFGFSYLQVILLIV